MSSDDRPFTKEARLRSAINRRFVVRADALAGRRLTRESLLHFALSTGNLDPIHFDVEYATTSVRGRLVPPPTWYTEVMDPHVGCQALYTRLALDAINYVEEEPEPAEAGDSGPPAHFLDGLRSFDGGLGFEYEAVPPLGQQFTVAGHVTNVTAKRSERLGEFAVLEGSLDYAGPDGVFVKGSASSLVYALTNVRTPQVTAGPTRSASDVGEVAALAPIEAIGRQRRRGPEPRYWEEVRPGEAINELVKGRIDHAEIAVRSVSLGHSSRADELIRQSWELLAQGESLPAAQLYREIAANPEFGFGVARHLDVSEASSEGAPGAYDIGTQRAAWMAQAVTDWMGDAGTVTRFEIHIRGFVVVGDSVWCRGAVAAKEVRGDRHLVRLDLWVENQRGERVAVGFADVVLPTRAAP